MKLFLVAVPAELLNNALGARLSHHLKIADGVCGQVAVRYFVSAILLLRVYHSLLKSLSL